MTGVTHEQRHISEYLQPLHLSRCFYLLRSSSIDVRVYRPFTAHPLAIAPNAQSRADNSITCPCCLPNDRSPYAPALSREHKHAAGTRSWAVCARIVRCQWTGGCVVSFCSSALCAVYAQFLCGRPRSYKPSASSHMTYASIAVDILPFTRRAAPYALAV